MTGESGVSSPPLSSQVLPPIITAMGNKDRLAELQRQSKHAPVTEEEEMEPLNKNKKKQGRLITLFEFH